METQTVDNATKWKQFLETLRNADYVMRPLLCIQAKSALQGKFSKEELTDSNTRLLPEVREFAEMVADRANTPAARAAMATIEVILHPLYDKDRNRRIAEEDPALFWRKKYAQKKESTQPLEWWDKKEPVCQS
jgi:nucleoside-diphosphate-sugar epimerase